MYKGWNFVSTVGDESGGQHPVPIECNTREKAVNDLLYRCIKCHRAEGRTLRGCKLRLMAVKLRNLIFQMLSIHSNTYID